MPIVPSRFGRKYTAGHVFENGQHMFVSIVPIRFCVTPEIVLLMICKSGLIAYLDWTAISGDVPKTRIT